MYLFNSAVTIKIMRYLVRDEEVPNKTHTVTNVEVDPEVLNKQEEDRVIIKVKITDKFGDKNIWISKIGVHV